MMMLPFKEALAHLVSLYPRFNLFYFLSVQLYREIFHIINFSNSIEALDIQITVSNTYTHTYLYAYDVVLHTGF